MSISATQEGHTARTVGNADRVDAAFANARRHSSRVRLLKIILPIAAILMVAVFASRSWLAVPAGVSVNLAASGVENGRLVMADPRLEGFTGDNRAYTMAATRAIQDIGGGSRIDLEEIEARVPFDENGWMTVVAATGVYDSDAETLDLDKDVKIVTDTGITALLKSAVVDIAASSLASSDPVDITMEGTRIKADSMIVKDNGATMTFDGRVRVELTADRAREAAAAEGEVNGN